jgi:hypothetical protein
VERSQTRRSLRSRSLTSLTCALGAAAVLTACGPTNHRVIMKELRGQLARQYHACVPLGWNPVPASGSFYPGISVTVQEEGVWLPVMWLARIDARAAARPDVRAVARVLDELARIGMLSREAWPSGVRYRLTERALPYFFADDEHGNNPEALPYLCYSAIVPQRVVSNEDVHVENLHGAIDEAQVFRASFQWKPGPAAAWANDPVLRSHSVLLAPNADTLVAQFVKLGGSWRVLKVSAADSPLPILVDASVWPRGQHASAASPPRRL